MANPTEKECKNAFKKLQDYLPDGTTVRMDWVQVGQMEFYQIQGGYVVDRNGEKFYDPKTVFIVMCLDPVGVVLFEAQKVLQMRSFEGAIEWVIESFREGGFKLDSAEIAAVLT